MLGEYSADSAREAVGYFPRSSQKQANIGAPANDHVHVIAVSQGDSQTISAPVPAPSLTLRE